MNTRELPVTVAVQRPDGSIEHVRVGTAVQEADGFRLSFGDLRIGGEAVARRPAPARAPAGGAGEQFFPNYGRSKGGPIEGASLDDLEFYARGCRRTLDDAAKSRWHDKERALLAAIEAEIARQGGGGGGGERPQARGPSAWQAGPPPDDFAPPPSDDDIPF
jgi:hypothetical protein